MEKIYKLKVKIARIIIISAGIIIWVSLITVLICASNSSKDDNYMSNNNSAVSDVDWLYNKYWIYADSGGDTTDVFAFNFIDNNTVEFGHLYEEDYGDGAIGYNFDNVKKNIYIRSEDNKYGALEDTNWVFCFDDNNGKVHLFKDEMGSIELVAFDVRNSKNLSKAVEKSNEMEYDETTFHPSEAKYNLDNIQLDFNEDTINNTGNETGNYPNPQIAQQGDYLYYLDNKSIKKVNVSGISNYLYDSDDDNIQESTTLIELSHYNTIRGISVYKNYVYFMVIDSEDAKILRTPTRYFGNAISTEQIATCESEDYFIINGKLYYVKAKYVNSASTKMLSLYSIDLNNQMTENKVFDIDKETPDNTIEFIGIDKNYAYWVKYGNNQIVNTDYFVRCSLSNGEKTQVTSSEKIEAINLFQICNGNLYSKLSTTEFMLNRFYLSDNTSYLKIDFSNLTSERIYPDLEFSIRYFFNNGDVIVAQEDIGTYYCTKNDYQKGDGLHLTDDFIGTPYVFDDDIYYYYDDGLYHVTTNGLSWHKIADIAITD